ncbi:MAG: ATP-dependent sacrificial sulfur transferase LarE [Candidatus Sericytochromatia bacterium]|nr:ATP-dependent sacrificial sulfur transferase LarE [Candidatus Tanganyikabacteria bacterium]
MAALDRLLAALSRHESVIVALSGGVDSATVAAAAFRALGSRALAVTSGSASVSAEELAHASRVAAEIGIAHRVVQTREIDDPGYVANGADRCYHCKTALYGDLAKIARAEGYAAICNGTNCDDLGDHRPGLRAADEHLVASPLVEAGLGKPEVREIARALGLSIWDKPANACLASRLPHGTFVTLGRLDQVGRAEEAVSALGFRGHRVRHHGEVGRLEVPADQLARALEMRADLSAALKDAGYRYAVLDLDGYRQGSLNPVSEAKWTRSG